MNPPKHHSSLIFIKEVLIILGWIGALILEIGSLGIVISNHSTSTSKAHLFLRGTKPLTQQIPAARLSCVTVIIEVWAAVFPK